MAKKCIANKTGTYLIHLDYITLNLLLQIFSLLTDMVTASYCTPAMQDLHKDALEAGITIVNEVSNRYHSRFFVQVRHETMYAGIENHRFFTTSYQDY